MYSPKHTLFPLLFIITIASVFFGSASVLQAHGDLNEINQDYNTQRQSNHDHILSDYIQAEEARQRNEPPFVVKETKARGAKARTAATNVVGQWSAVKTWPFVFASASNLPDGRIAAWGGNNRTYFNGGKYTYTGVWDPTTDQITEQGYNEHSMFCAIPTMREDGTVFVVGGDGSTNNHTSLFDYRTDNWTHIDTANVGRWYNGSLQLPNGQVFMALGSGGSRYPERWTEGTGWEWLTGIDLQGPILSHTSYWSEHWFPQLTLAPSGDILHVGPTPKMHWIDPAGNGTIREAGAGITGWDTHNQSGTMVMFDKGKVLTLGGVKAQNRVTIVDMNSDTPQVTPIANMNQPRVTVNAVMLPSGEVFVVGGTAGDVNFSDVGSILTPEIWNPQTQTWRQVANHAVPRNYHAVALLMTDGRVFSGGGGLCNCAADHPNHQIYSPSYLFNADGSLATRPTIDDAPDVVTFGQTIDVQTSSDIQKFSLIKMTGTTHAYSSDLRFLNVPFNGDNGQYQLTLDDNSNVLTPGYWMLFALNSQGTPSVAKVIQVRTAPQPVPSTPGPYRYVKLVAESEINGNPWASAAELYVLDGNSNPIDRSSWTASATSQEFDSPATHAIDGKINTIWNTQWRTIAPRHPHQLIVDMGAAYDVSGFRYLPHQGGVNGTIAKYSFYVSKDGINWSQPVAQGTFANNQNEKTVSFADVIPLFNLSKGQEATQSSYYLNPLNPVAADAVDGNTNGNWAAGSVSSTRNETNAWWEVDLGQVSQVDTIHIWNRTDCCANRLSNFHVFVSDEPFASTSLAATQSQAGVTDLAYPGSAGQSTDFTVNRTGRYVRVQLEGTNILHMAEVQVIGSLTLPISPILIQPQATTPQSVNTSIPYTANATGNDNLRYRWLFGDGTSETNWSSSSSLSHTFANPGLYRVKVTVADDNGQEVEHEFYQAIHGTLTANQPTVSMSVIYEERSGNNRVWNVNPDNDTVSVLDVVPHQKVDEIGVGSAPRSLAIAPDGRIWVTNKHDATISIIDATSLNVIQTVTLPHASQPYGIAFAPNGSAVYVALEATGQLLKLNPTSGAQLDSADVGINARHLSISADSNKVYVSRFITPPVPGEATANPQVNQGGGEVVALNSDSMNVDSTIQLRHSNIGDGDSGGRGIPNYLGPAVIAPDGLTAWVPSKKDNIARGTLRDGNNLNHENTVRSISSYINLSNGQENLGKRIDHNNGGIASTALFGRYGNYLFVALEGSREVAVVDAYANNELFRIDVGRAPQGLALSSDGLTLYVHNFMERSISVHDVSELIERGKQTVNNLITVDVVASEQLSTQVLLGKQLFYDAKDTRLVRDNYASCAACHNEGDSDGRVWDMTGFGEGLRNTIDLNGHAGTGQGLLHWSGNFDEVHDFEGQIRGLAGGTGLMSDSDFNTGTRSQSLGDPKASISADLDALAAYVGSLTTFADSPYRDSDGSLTATGEAGRTVFKNNNCASCHGGQGFTDSAPNNLHDVGTIKPTSGSRLGSSLTGIDTPTLRGIWATAPYLHDGSAATLTDAVQAHNNVSLYLSELNQVVAFLNQIDGSEPEPTGTTNNNAPVLTNPGNQTSTVGDSINLTVTANGNSLNYSATGLPNGLIINSSNGTISGTANVAGSFNVTVTVIDGNGGSDSVGFSWEVKDPSLVSAAVCEAGVDPQVIRRGEGTALWWWSDGVTTANINQGIGSVNLPSDYKWLSPTETTTYTMTAQDSNGTATTCKATVVVEGDQIEQNPSVCQLGADPQSIRLGEGSALWWWSDNLSSATIDNGIGSVTTPSDYTWFYPTQTTTYIMTGSSATGVETSCQTTIVVN